MARLESLDVNALDPNCVVVSSSRPLRSIENIQRERPPQPTLSSDGSTIKITARNLATQHAQPPQISYSSHHHHPPHNDQNENPSAPIVITSPPNAPPHEPESNAKPENNPLGLPPPPPPPHQTSTEQQHSRSRQQLQSNAPSTTINHSLKTVPDSPRLSSSALQGRKLPAISSSMRHSITTSEPMRSMGDPSIVQGWGAADHSRNEELNEGSGNAETRVSSHDVRSYDYDDAEVAPEPNLMQKAMSHIEDADSAVIRYPVEGYLNMEAMDIASSTASTPKMSRSNDLARALDEDTRTPVPVGAGVGLGRGDTPVSVKMPPDFDPVEAVPEPVPFDPSDELGKRTLISPSSAANHYFEATLSSLHLFSGSFDTNALAYVADMTEDQLHSQLLRMPTGAVLPLEDRRYQLRSDIKLPSISAETESSSVHTERIGRFVEFFTNMLVELGTKSEESNEMDCIEMSVTGLLHQEWQNIANALLLCLKRTLSFAPTLTWCFDKSRKLIETQIEAKLRTELFQSLVDALDEKRKRTHASGLRHSTPIQYSPTRSMPSTTPTKFKDMSSEQETDRLEVLLNLELGRACLDLEDFENGVVALKTAENKWRFLDLEVRDSATLAVILSHLGTAYLKQDMNEEAESTFADVINLRPQVGDRKEARLWHADTLVGLSVSLEKMGRYSEVLPMIQQAVDIYSSVCDREDPKLVVAICNLAHVSSLLGKFERSEELWAQALTAREAIYGPRSSQVAQVLKGLGVLYNKQGRYERARTHLTKAKGIFEERFGSSHPSVAQCLNNLAFALHREGNLEEALTKYETALDITVKSHGPEHPTVAQQYSNLGSIYLEKEDYNKAEMYYTMALSIRRLKFGPHHPEVAKTLFSLAVLSSDTGRLEEAVDLYQSCLDIQVKAFGPNHQDVARTKRNLTMLQKMSGKKIGGGFGCGAGSGVCSIQ